MALFVNRSARDPRHMKLYEFFTRTIWTGNDGSGTATSTFGRDSELLAPGKPTIPGSAPPEFGGDGLGWSPEDLLVAAVSECHMLTFLFLCSRAGITVDSYVDSATGVLEVSGPIGQFTEIELQPVVVISTGDPEVADALHAKASEGCFVGRSLKTEIRVVSRTSSAVRL